MTLLSGEQPHRVWGTAEALCHARNPMAAQQIPSGNQGLRPGPRRIGNPASAKFFGKKRLFENNWVSCRRALFEAKSPAKPRDLRRNGPIRVQFPQLAPDRARSRRMNPAGPRHTPVLGRQAIEMLGPCDGGIYVDATFGAGGYSRAILGTAGTRVIGIDRDRTAIAGGFDLVDRSGGRLTLVEAAFSHMSEVCAPRGVAGVD